ncbi:two-component system regulatory protein [Oleiphilus messinensis]|uniref:Two-component system regulatory protein n=1 Tax=Oleiphilus messinensis TaxID=141451 RepID=A0A1Y0I4H3_9GAMM|nr:response regulator transcription factor [Oleiphilus messinensis]ARU55387.1 two-component system regulatory protein [Oleiphilus messinensis]
MIKVVLVEDQNLVREGIKGLLALREEIQVIGEAEDGEQGLDVLRDVQPDVVLLDIRMPKKDGVQMLHAMQSEGLTIPTLVLTTFDDHDLVLACLKAGAKGYLRKDVSLDELVSAIQTLSLGQDWVQPAVTSRIEGHKAAIAYTDAQAVQSLTSIELQVLRLIAAGYSNQEIAEALSKSVGTVRNQVSFILAKLDVRDRTRAVLKAIDLGII